MGQIKHSRALRIMRRDPCPYCGRRMTVRRRGAPERPTDATIDHVHPLSRGGGNGPDNRVVACAACNRAKGSMSLLEFLSRS